MRGMVSIKYSGDIFALSHSNGCCYFALSVTLESNLRVQWAKHVTLSTRHLIKLDADSRRKLPDVRGKPKRLVLMVQNEGVYEEEQYEKIMRGELSEAPKCKIIEYTAYKMNDQGQMRAALHQLRRGGPYAVLRISSNYDDCKRSGVIYRYDPNLIVHREDGLRQTHAVSVVSFAVEAKAPILECQDSHGRRFGREGFLAVDPCSVKELYSFRVRLSIE
ncbi:unnamed protein product [Urochloa decumbens]|uniref:Peptidase C1A papain C-terminal domain-containing protein n=1 Tax=Urochloa decumbens TaxID=240449 RepID=A0ABC9CQ84_9POAL